MIIQLRSEKLTQKEICVRLDAFGDSLPANTSWSHYCSWTEAFEREPDKVAPRLSRQNSAARSSLLILAGYTQCNTVGAYRFSLRTYPSQDNNEQKLQRVLIGKTNQTRRCSSCTGRSRNRSAHDARFELENRHGSRRRTFGRYRVAVGQHGG